MVACVYIYLYIWQNCDRDDAVLRARHRLSVCLAILILYVLPITWCTLRNCTRYWTDTQVLLFSKAKAAHASICFDRAYCTNIIICIPVVCYNILTSQWKCLTACNKHVSNRPAAHMSRPTYDP